jgi:hypothetical protein
MWNLNNRLIHGDYQVVGFLSGHPVVGVRHSLELPSNTALDVGPLSSGGCSGAPHP